MGIGAINTAFILAGCSERPIAASVCSDLVLNGYSDWYLPTYSDWVSIYNRLHLQGKGSLTNDIYWTSYQFPNGNACAFDISTGFLYNWMSHTPGSPKNFYFRVRAVRAF
jgi:hypothetical protein